MVNKVKNYVVSIDFSGRYETTVRATSYPDARELARKRLDSVLEPADIDYEEKVIFVEEATQYD